MSDLSPEDRRLLAELREDLLPKAGDAERIRAGLEQTLAAPTTATSGTFPLAKVGLFGLGATAAIALIGVVFWPKESPAPKVPTAEEIRPPERAVPSVALPKSPRSEDEPSAEAPRKPDAPTRTSAPTLAPHREERAPAQETNSLAEEVRLLREADLALRQGKYEEANAFLKEHQTRFPSGLLSREREGTKVLVACRNESSPAVKNAASQYLARVPSSPLTQRIEVACSLERK